MKRVLSLALCLYTMPHTTLHSKTQTELPPSTIEVVEWKIPQSLPKGLSAISGSVQVIPMGHSSELTLKLHKKGGAIAGTIVFLRARAPIWASPLEWVHFNIPINEDLPEGKYRLEIIPQTDQTVKGNTFIDLTIGQFQEQLILQKIIASGANQKWKVGFASPASSAGNLEAWFFNEQNELMATASFPFDKGAREVAVDLPDTPRWKHGGKGMIQFHVGSWNTSSEPVSVNLPEMQKAAHKPIAHGVYLQDNGAKHYWHASDDHLLFWNGLPWIPFGGMFYLYAAKPTLDERRAERVSISETLDVIQKFGFNDLYVNADVGHRSPDWHIQSTVDEFNRRGIEFGWQLTTGAKPFPAYQIFSSVKQGLIRVNVTEPGVLKISLPLLNITEILLIPVNGSGNAIAVPFSMTEKVKSQGLEIIQILESSNNLEEKKDFEIKVDALVPGDYYVLLKSIEQGKRVSNVWERLDETKDGLDWISRIDWGAGLRFFVDPICNEGGINNRYEVVRVWSSAFNLAFEKWLQAKYENSIAKIESAWKLPEGKLQCFSQASRLLPLRDLDSLRFRQALTMIDPETGVQFDTQNGEGYSWLDYLQAVRETYAQGRDEIARYLKTRVNVPVVIKRVAPWLAVEGIPGAPGGIDGIGLELYPESGSGVPYGGITGRAEADLAKQTTWLLATELGYSAKPGNRDIQSWPDKETFRRAVRETWSTGAKGFYLFGWRLPGKEWANHILTNQPVRMEWAKEISEELKSSPPVIWKKYGIVFPEGQSWWWKSNKEPWTRYNCVYKSAPSALNQSVVLKINGEEQLWAASSSLPIEQADPVVINLSNAFYADYYALPINDLFGRGKRVIYLGHWPRNAKSIPELDRHFIPGQLTSLDGGGEIQPLQVFPGDTILETDANGRVWAKLSGRLLIVSAAPVSPPNSNTMELPRFLKQEWVDLLLKAP